MYTLLEVNNRIHERSFDTVHRVRGRPLIIIVMHRNIAIGKGRRAKLARSSRLQAHAYGARRSRYRYPVLGINKSAMRCAVRFLILMRNAVFTL